MHLSSLVRPTLLRRFAALLVVPLALVAGGCGFFGSGDIEFEERELEGFDSVVNSSSLDVDITIGDSEGVRVACDANRLHRIDTWVVDGALHIDTSGLFSLRRHGRCRVEIDVVDVRAVENAGSGDVQIAGEAAELGFIAQYGSGTVVVDELTAPDVDVRSTGSGGVHLAGVTSDVSYVSSGSGGIHARELRAETVTASSTGSGGLELHASELLDAQLVGSGDIHVWGAPKDHHSQSIGSGRVIFH